MTSALAAVTRHLVLAGTHDFWQRMGNMRYRRGHREYKPYDPMDVLFYGWVIYDHPIDYPEWFVVRRWAILGPQVIPTPADQESRLAQTIEGARALLPANVEPGPPPPQPRPVPDHYHPVEVWIEA